MPENSQIMSDTSIPSVSKSSSSFLPTPTTAQRCAHHRRSLDFTESSFHQETAARINSHAIRMYEEQRFEEALHLYKEGLSLLNSMDSENSNEDDSEESISEESNAFWRLSEVIDFHQAIELPLDTLFLAENASSKTEDVVSVFIMYNLFLALRVSGHPTAALEILELVRSIVQPFSYDANSESSRWHPSFILSIQYHLGALAFECDEKELAWQIFVQATEIGRKLKFQLLYGKLCVRIGGIMMEEHLFDQAETAFHEASTIYQKTFCHNNESHEDIMESASEDSIAFFAAPAA